MEKPIHGQVSPDAACYAFAQNDKAGQTWLADIASAGCKVLGVATPAPHKDANDWTRAGATKGDIEAAMKAAKPVLTQDADKPNPWTELLQDGADIAAETLPPVVQIVEDILPGR